MGVKVTGLKEFERELKDLGNRAQKLQGTTDVPLSELLNLEFLISKDVFSLQLSH